MAPLVSIVMPAFRASRWIDAALQSARAQSYRELEIIVVDDASPDDTAARVEVHAAVDPRVRLFRLPKNQGQCAAANHGLAQAHGSYIKFFDADDLLDATMIARQVAALSHRPGHMAYGEWARFHTDPSEAIFRARPGWHDATPVDWLVEIWADAQPMMQCAQFLIPRDLLQLTGGWDERLGLINDFEFFSRLTLASKGIVFTPGARLFYRSGLPGSLSVSRSAQAWESACLSITLGCGYLLAAENSPRTRQAVANLKQGLIYELYPNMPGCVRRLAAHVRELGGSTLRPFGGRGFQLASRLLGWKTARWLQIWAGKYPRPIVRESNSARP